MATDPLGIDIDCVTDLDPWFRLCRGSRNLGNALLRRLNADPGCMDSVGDDPNYGYNLPGQLLSEVSSQGELASINAAIQAQMALDERVQSVDVRLVASVE
jgi:hypothetical protein